MDYKETCTILMKILKYMHTLFIESHATVEIELIINS